MNYLTYNQKIEIILDKSDISTKKELAEELDMSRPTLDSRIKGSSSWKKLEMNWINYLYRKIK